ncbi:helicase-related protein [Allocoleopsis sp.]|uniref:helicase-related protein n=1 Tax=Allocoleopsis sp. TaxID=3088169 RepID=UPI002FD3857E
MSYQIVDAQEFLSGDIHAKLEAAKDASIYDPSYLREVEALTAAIPDTVSIGLVDIRIGATWIPVEYYEEFCWEMFEERVQFFYSPLAGTWETQLKTSGEGEANKRYGFCWQTCDSQGYTVTDWYTAVSKKPEDGLFTMALLFKAPSVSVKKSKEAPNKKDQAETAKAVAKQEELQLMFANWCREGDRGEQLEKIYNTKINRTVLPNWDGKGAHLREHLLAAGMAPAWVNKLRPYQLDSIWRMCVGGNTLLGLEVGLGKSLSLIAAAMLRRFYKTSKKALFVVQRSTLKQFEQAFRETFPDAKVLCATPEDCSAGNRQRLLAKAALWDWDAVILTHESFNKIPVKAQTERVYIEKQLEVVEMELFRLYELGETAKSKGKKRGNRIVKKLEEMRNKIRDRIDTLNKAKDSGIYYEDLDPCILIIDEAQKYKNAFVATKLQVTGINISESARAQDFELKLAYMRDRHKQGFLWLSTGTPEPTNSMVGVFVYQRYLHPEELEKRGLAHFDAWAMNFGRVVSEAEFKADGGLRITDRFCEFVNLPELLQMWLSSCHIKRFDDVAGQAGFIRPKPRHKKVSCHLSDWQLNYMDYIQRRYDMIAKRNPLKWPAKDKDGCLLDEDEKRLYHPLSGDPIFDVEVAQAHGLNVGVIIDNFFKICSESRNLMIAPQLLDPELPIDTGDKISQAVRRIHRWWKLTAKNKSTQLVFLDVGTPGGSAKFCIYDWMRQELRDRGIPDAEMAFIHDYPDDEDKAELFDKVNAGEIRVLFGSTEPMGIGVNVQKKVKVVHLIDIPRRPDQYEQRLGRAIRFGNENPTVLIYQYLTRGKAGNFGANAFELQLLEKKVKVREDILRGDPTVRRVVEDNNQVEMYMKLKAHSSGDERILRYVDCAAELDKAKAKSALCITDLNRLHGSIKDADRRINTLELELANIVPDIETARSHVHCVDGDMFVCQVDDALHVGMSFVERGKGKFKKPQFKMALCLSDAIAPLCLLSYPTANQAKHLADKHIQQKVDMFALELRFRENNGKQWHIGYFGGFELWCMLHEFREKVNVTMWLKGQVARRPVEFRTSQLRLIRNLINAHDEILDLEVHKNNNLTKQRETLSKLKDALAAKRAEKDGLVEAARSLELEKQQLAAALNMSNEN